MGSTTEVHPPQPFNTTIDSTIELPDSNSPDLHLAHPTPEECITIWTSTSASWRDSLTLPVYLTESQFLTTVPLAKDGGMTIWILDDKNLPLNKRPILCSCESFRKRSLTSDAAGNVRENIVHGIASVFCAPQYRRRGYAARHMKEMAKILRHWQAEHGEPVGSVLYSDIGKEYYARLGWIPNATNTHFVFPPHRNETPQLAREILEDDLQALCDQDKVTIRGAMATPADAVSKRATILPDLDHMLWHIGKECFAAQYIFGGRHGKPWKAGVGYLDTPLLQPPGSGGRRQRPVHSSPRRGGGCHCQQGSGKHLQIQCPGSGFCRAG